MGKAYTPTVASSNTSSAVKTNMAQLQGTSPLQKFGSDPQPNGNPHVRIGPQAFSSPMQKFGASVASLTHETRNSVNGVPHINMHPA
jgi:hypothetical protein